MTIYELAALTAAALWAVGGMISATPSRELGAVAYVQIRMVIIAFMLAAYVLIANTWNTVQFEHYQPLILSGLIGIFLGDTTLFLTLNRVGPRRTAILFSLAAPISVLLGWVFLNEKLSYLQITGVMVITVGVIMAVIFGKRKSQQHQWEDVKGKLWVTDFGLARLEADAAMTMTGDLMGTLRGLDPSETLFIICSKSFTTQETLANARAARSWLVKG
ncbi:MAG: EamA family transporter, partial [Rhizobiales bacterium]|nr:EamA family transporter [Hyphomicrobiales bacterium]